MRGRPGRDRFRGLAGVLSGVVVWGVLGAFRDVKGQARTTRKLNRKLGVQVASVFVVQTPTILVLPAVQAFRSRLWCLPKGSMFLYTRY